MHFRSNFRASPLLAHRRLLVPLALALLTSVCDGANNPTTPDSAVLRGTDGVAIGPGGLEQRVVTRLEPAPPGSPYTRMLVATSTLRNTGSAPARVTIRICFVQESDVQSTASLDRFEPLVACASGDMTILLAPGLSAGPIEVRFGVRSGPGQYTLRLRHSLDPDFRTEVGFTIP